MSGFQTWLWQAGKPFFRKWIAWNSRGEVDFMEEGSKTSVWWSVCINPQTNLNEFRRKDLRKLFSESGLHVGTKQLWNPLLKLRFVWSCVQIQICCLGIWSCAWSGSIGKVNRIGEPCNQPPSHPHQPSQPCFVNMLIVWQHWHYFRIRPQSNWEPIFPSSGVHASTLFGGQAWSMWFIARRQEGVSNPEPSAVPWLIHAWQRICFY